MRSWDLTFHYSGIIQLEDTNLTFDQSILASSGGDYMAAGDFTLKEDTVREPDVSRLGTNGSSMVGQLSTVVNSNSSSAAATAATLVGNATVDAANLTATNLAHLGLLHEVTLAFFSLDP